MTEGDCFEPIMSDCVVIEHKTSSEMVFLIKIESNQAVQRSDDTHGESLVVAGFVRVAAFEGHVTESASLVFLYTFLAMLLNHQVLTWEVVID